MLASACSPSDKKPDVLTGADRKEMADSACPEVTVPTFFYVEKNGVTSYLLGTRHAGVRLDKFPSYVRDKVAAQTTLVEEAILDHPPREWPKPDKPLSETLDAKTWAKFKTLVGDDVAAAVDKEGPIVAIATATFLFEDTDQRIDLEVEKQYRAANKEIVPLEDAARTDEIGVKMLDVPTLALMINAVPSRDVIQQQMKNDLAMYCRGDYSLPSDREPIRKMSLERNEDWVPKLIPILDKGGALIMVGRDHVVAHGGLVDLLRRRGYKVQLVKP